MVKNTRLVPAIIRHSAAFAATYRVTVSKCGCEQQFGQQQ